ncbi:MAG: hypothetical protein ACM3JB_04325 [Acidobacteriaceae bacterium]
MDSRRIITILFVLLFPSTSLFAQSATSPDSDHDGLSDALEQQLLEKFRPVFMIDARECDVAPASFAPGRKLPVQQHRDGTIYGQAMPAKVQSSDGTQAIELHYYHLWSRDCGRMGHALDAEHVSALVEDAGPSTTLPGGRSGRDDGGVVVADRSGRGDGASVSDWRARYWYAAAHEDTLCDASAAAKASVLHAESMGPVVWISNGKHASFLNREDCKHGCGGDRCGEMKEAPRAALINVGEPDAPMNGALWINSQVWPLPQKLQPDFDATLVTQIDALSAQTEIIRVSSVPGSVRAVIGAGNATVNGVETGVQTGNEHTGSALSTAGKHTWRALGTSYRSVKKAITPPQNAGQKSDQKDEKESEKK